MDAQKDHASAVPPARVPFARRGSAASALSNHLPLSTILISNMHCSSCIRTIEDSLSELSPRPTNLEVSIVSQTVTLHLPDGLSLSDVTDALDEAGFDVLLERPPPVASSSTRTRLSLVHKASKLSAFFSKRQKHADQCMLCGADSGAHEHAQRTRTLELPYVAPTLQSSLAPVDLTAPPSPRHSFEGKKVAAPGHGGTVAPVPLLDVSLSIGGMTCASCANSISRALAELDGVSDVVISVLGHSGTCKVTSRAVADEVVSAIEDCGFEAEIVDLHDAPATKATAPKVAPAAANTLSTDGPQRLELSIGGMTCASCSNAITDALNGMPGVSDVHVNLLGNSGSVTVESYAIAAKVVEAIEDIGYEAHIVVQELIARASSPEAEGATTRRIALHVDGMYCKHCPESVMASLQPLVASGRVAILKSLASQADPIIELEYTPEQPNFTIRTIIQTIAMSKPSESEFTVTLHKPATLEERARRMYEHEQRALLQRVLFTVVVAIPTFIIGVVYMSLVPHDNATRMWFMSPMWVGRASRAAWALFFLATPVMFYSCGLFHRRSFKEIRALWRKGSRMPVWKRFIRFGSMNLLVSAGVSVAYFSSIVLLALGAAQTPASPMDGDTTTYFDAVIFLGMFLLLGRYLEAYSKSRTSDAITALGKLRPSTAFLVTSGGWDEKFEPPTPADEDVEKRDSVNLPPGQRVVKVDAELLEAGDLVRIFKGSTPPADGFVVAGPYSRRPTDGALTTFDESSLTGESKPVPKHDGDDVFLGTINTGDAIEMRVKAVGGDSMLDQIVRVVREGQTKRAPIERVADQITAYFVPVVTYIAIADFLIWLGLGLGGVLPQSYLDIEVGGWAIWALEFSLALFVTACPCGIGLAAPTALLVGSGVAAKLGVLARGGGEAFQEAAQVDLIVFDKTGTLTEGGEPRVTNAEIVKDYAWPTAKPVSSTENTIAAIAYEIEGASSHPLAISLRNYCHKDSAASKLQVQASNIEETPGRGLRAHIDAVGCTAIIGNEAWMAEHGATIGSELIRTLDEWKGQAKSVVLLALSHPGQPTYSVVAAFAIADVIRPEAERVVKTLQKQGISVWMISGDNVLTAKAVARMVGIDEANVIADVLPHEKADKVRWLQQVGPKRPKSFWRRLLRRSDRNPRCVVAFTGDGINDSPALTVADVGIAMGSGSDVALSSASFILVSSNLDSLLSLFRLSRKVFNRVRLNFLWAMIYNAAMIPIAAGVFYPAGHTRLPPVWASLAMALSSVSVVCSSLLLKLYKP